MTMFFGVMIMMVLVKTRMIIMMVVKMAMILLLNPRQRPIVQFIQVCNGRSLSRGQCDDGSDEAVDCCLDQVLNLIQKSKDDLREMFFAVHHRHGSGNLHSRRWVTFTFHFLQIGFCYCGLFFPG